MTPGYYTARYNSDAHIETYETAETENVFCGRKLGEFSQFSHDSSLLSATISHQKEPESIGAAPFSLHMTTKEETS